MNTVERVARAICSQWVADNYGWEGYIQKDFVEENWTSHKDEAKAALNALNALAAGLEWDENGRILLLGVLTRETREGPVTTKIGIGTVWRDVSSRYGWQLGFNAGVSPNAVTGEASSMDTAREALMTAARKWLIGD